jgi:hypothetical protein
MRSTSTQQLCPPVEPGPPPSKLAEGLGDLCVGWQAAASMGGAAETTAHGQLQPVRRSAQRTGQHRRRPDLEGPACSPIPLDERARDPGVRSPCGPVDQLTTAAATSSAAFQGPASSQSTIQARPWAETSTLPDTRSPWVTTSGADSAALAAANVSTRPAPARRPADQLPTPARPARLDRPTRPSEPRHVRPDTRDPPPRPRRSRGRRGG